MKWVAVLRVLTFFLGRPCRLCFNTQYMRIRCSYRQGVGICGLLNKVIHAYVRVSDGRFSLLKKVIVCCPALIYDTACFHSVSDWCERKSVYLLSTNLHFLWWVIVLDRASQFSSLNLWQLARLKSTNSKPGVQSIYTIILLTIIAGSCTLEPLVCGIWNPKQFTSKGFIILLPQWSTASLLRLSLASLPVPWLNCLKGRRLSFDIFDPVCGSAALAF